MTTASLATDFDPRSVSDWSRYREQNFPIARNWRYFDHAAVSPLPGPTRQAIQRWLDQATEEGDTVWPDWARRLEEIRGTAANLIAADSTEMAFIPSTSFGISLIAEGLDWQAGDNVVLPAGEFPSNLYPWMNLQSRGVELRIVPTGPHGEFTPEQVAEHCDHRTRLVSASWVGYATGFRTQPAELAAIAHQHGALFFLDAIQGLGVFPLDVKAAGIDFLAADGHKWMMGPEGAGLFYCRKELLDQVQPRVIGWNSVQSPFDFGSIDFTLKKNASRFEAGTQNVAGFLGLGASLDLITAVGVTPRESPMAERILEITNELIAALEKIGWTFHGRSLDEQRSGIVAFSKPGIEPAAARQTLLDHQIVCSVRKDRLRFSPHAYINQEDVDRVAEVLRDC